MTPEEVAMMESLGYLKVKGTSYFKPYKANVPDGILTDDQAVFLCQTIRDKVENSSAYHDGYRDGSATAKHEAQADVDAKVREARNSWSYELHKQADNDIDNELSAKDIADHFDKISQLKNGETNEANNS